MEDPINTDSEFWRLLIENGTLDASLAEEFKTRMRFEWQPLGQIFIHNRVLGMGRLHSQLAVPQAQ